VLEAARLRRERFDGAIVLRPDHWWGALLALAAGIPVRVGARTLETAPLLSHSRQLECAEHAAEQALSLARLLLSAFRATPAPSFETRQFTMSQAAQREAASFVPHGRTIALQPGAGAPLKSWPVERWAALGEALRGNGLDVVLIGAPEERPLLSAIVARMAKAPTVACGQSLEVSAAVYSRCELLVSVDGGAAHLAAAVGTPTIRLYGPAAPSRFGPWPRRDDQRVLVTDRLACVPCGNLESPPCGARIEPACMLALGVDSVLNAIRIQLSQS
jgi:ADP-heptose:LPS heptosyltransferase